MRYRPDHKRLTRERVLKAAGRAILTEGPRQAAVAGIMSGAGLTHGGFYAHFDSKDALVAAAVDDKFDEGCAWVAREMEGRTPGDGVAAYIDAYLSRRHRRARATGCPLPALLAEVPHLPARTRRRFVAGLARFTDRLAGALARSGCPDASHEATTLVAELAGTLLLARAMGESPASDALLRRSRAAIKQRLRLVLRQAQDER